MNEEIEHINKLILKNINFEIKDKELICIIGEVGSGKSSLLLSILNNLIQYNTKIYLNGSIAYVSQVPWICNNTVKSNFYLIIHLMKKNIIKLLIFVV